MNHSPTLTPLSHKESHELDYWRGLVAELTKNCVTPEEIKAALTGVCYEKAYPRYKESLYLKDDSLKGKRILDLGCGPHCGIIGFTDCEKHGLDPLIEGYRGLGYPLDEHGVQYHAAHSEATPFEDGYFDVVICVNALDHVDNVEATIREISRILKPEGKFIGQINFHTDATICEPQCLDAQLMHRLFSQHGMELIESKYQYTLKDMTEDRYYYEFEKRSQDSPEASLDTQAILVEATQALQNGELEKAEALSRRLLALHGDNTHILNMHGFICYSSGKTEDAEFYFQSAYTADQNNLDAGKNLLDVYIKQEKYLDAVQVCRDILQTTPNDPDIERTLSQLLQDTAPVVYAEPKRSKGKVTLVVCLFENNYGDNLIYNTIDSKLKAHGFETEPIEVSQSLRQSGLVEKANSSDFLYFVGGGIIERHAPEIIRDFNKIHPNLKVPHGVVGLSTGAFDYTDFAYPMRLFCDTASFFYTRDEESVEAFKRVGATRLPVAGVDVVLANDLVREIRSNGYKISASFRNVPYPDVTGDMNWAAWASELKVIGITSLINDCSPEQAKLMIPIDQNPIPGQIANSDIVIAMRYHVILTAAMMGVLPIPIAYCPKVERLAEQLGLSEYCLGIHDHSKLEETFRKLSANSKVVRQNMLRRVYELEQRADAIISESIELMECAII